MGSLWESLLSHQGRLVHKWTHYFPAYENHFSRYVNRPVTLWEIGVAQGGSLQLWKQYLGPYAQIVGLDILDKSRYEEDQIAVRVGDQSDPLVLQGLLDEFGPPNVVLDDGSHLMSDVRATFSFIYPRMANDGVYVVEDLHTAYWPEYGGGLRQPSSFVEVAKNLIDELNAESAFGAALIYRDAALGPLEQSVPPSEFSATTLSMHFYDSLIVFERGRHLRRWAPKIGNRDDALEE